MERRVNNDIYLKNGILEGERAGSFLIRNVLVGCTREKVIEVHTFEGIVLASGQKVEGYISGSIPLSGDNYSAFQGAFLDRKPQLWTLRNNEDKIIVSGIGFVTTGKIGTGEETFDIQIAPQQAWDRK